MQIRTRLSMSADSDVTTPDGWPALIADSAFVSGQSHDFPEFQATATRSGCWRSCRRQPGTRVHLVGGQ